MGPISRYLVKVYFDTGVLSLIISPTENTWLMAKPFISDWRKRLGGIAGQCDWMWGTDRITLYDSFSRRRLALNAFSSDTQPGQRGEALWAFNLDHDKLNFTRTRWEAVGRPLPGGKTGVWVGLAGKMSAGAGIGSEHALAAVWSLDDPSDGLQFWYGSLRAGAIAGGSAGLSLCLVTGVRSEGDLANFATSGTDWAFALGVPLGKAAGVIGSIGATINKWGLSNGGKFIKLAEALAVCAKHKDSLVLLGKTVLINSSIDPEATGISFLDLPGPGIEAGAYWYWASVVSSQRFKNFPDIAFVSG